MSRYFCPFPRG